MRAADSQIQRRRPLPGSGRRKTAEVAQRTKCLRWFRQIEDRQWTLVDLSELAKLGDRWAVRAILPSGKPLGAHSGLLGSVVDAQAECFARPHEQLGTDEGVWSASHR